MPTNSPKRSSRKRADPARKTAASASAAGVAPQAGKDASAPVPSPARAAASLRRRKPSHAVTEAAGLITDDDFMGRALVLARRGCGLVTPNPMVGAVLVLDGTVIGEGWHRAAGQPHAEIEALRQAKSKRRSVRGADLFVTLEPCSTAGRTPPCTDALREAGLRRVVVGAVDPNPEHAGRGLDALRAAGLDVAAGVRGDEAAELNPAFNHWIVHRTPWVTVKAAMTLDGKIATAGGASKWITGDEARARGMALRRDADAILVGVNTVLADDPSLTFRPERLASPAAAEEFEAGVAGARKTLRRIVVDTQARTPLHARVVRDASARDTTVVVGAGAPKHRVAALEKKVRVLQAPEKAGAVNLEWLMKQLGGEEVTSVLVEGGGEINASVLFSGLAHRVAFFYATTIVGGFCAPRAVGGDGVNDLKDALRLRAPRWETVGADLLLTAEVIRGDG